MGAMMEKKHFTIAIDWSEKPLETWLEQYGSWLLIGNHADNLGCKSQIGYLIDLANGTVQDSRKRCAPRCNINDDQAQAIEDMLVHLRETEGEKIKRWLTIVGDYHVNFYSEEQIAQFYHLSRFAVTRDKMLGLVRIATRFKLDSRLTA